MTNREINKVDIERLTNELMETLFELRKTIDCLTNPFLLIMRSGKKGTQDDEFIQADLGKSVVNKSFTAKKTLSDQESTNMMAGVLARDHLGKRAIKTGPEKGSDLLSREDFGLVSSVQNMVYDETPVKGGYIGHVKSSTARPIIKARILKRLLGSYGRDILNSLESAGLVNSRECIQIISLLHPEQREKKMETSGHMNIILTTYIVNEELVPLNLAVLYGGSFGDDDRNWCR